MSTAPKNAIAQFLSDVASGKASLAEALADLAVASARVTELEASAVILTSERDTAKTALAALEVNLSEEKVAHTTLIAAHESLCASLGFKPAEITGKNETELQAALTSKISAMAIEQLAALGFDPNKLPSPKSDAPDPKKGGVLSYAEFSALTPFAKMEFSSAGGRIEG